MDCRKGLVLALLSLAVGCAGCVTAQQTAVKDAKPTDGPRLNPFAKNNPPAKRMPKFETCLESGENLEKEALSPRLTPLEKEKMLERARMAYQQALHTQPTHAKALLGLAHVYGHLNDYERAMTTYEKALQAHPHDASIWCDLGMAQCRQKQFDKAAGALRKALEIDPENRSYASNLGFCLARAGRTDEAVQVFTKLHGEAKAHYKVAQMLLHLERPENARHHLQLAVQRDPTHQPALELLSHIEQGDAPKRPIVNVGFVPQ